MYSTVDSYQSSFPWRGRWAATSPELVSGLIQNQQDISLSSNRVVSVQEANTLEYSKYYSVLLQALTSSHYSSNGLDMNE